MSPGDQNHFLDIKMVVSPVGEFTLTKNKCVGHSAIPLEPKGRLKINRIMEEGWE